MPLKQMAPIDAAAASRHSHLWVRTTAVSWHWLLSPQQVSSEHLLKRKKDEQEELKSSKKDASESIGVTSWEDTTYRKLRS